MARKKSIQYGIIDVAGHDINISRSRVNKRVYAYDRTTKLPIGNFRPKRSRNASIQEARERAQRKILKEEIEKPPEKEETLPKKKIYRTSLVIGYVVGVTKVEYRVWIHTEKSGITKDEAQDWYNKLFDLFPSAVNPLDELRYEDNEEIEEDEMLPEKIFDKWYGYVLFSLQTSSSAHGNAEYFAVQSGSEFVRSPPFREAEI